MAEVYAARDTQLRRPVALKRLRSDRDDSAATARLLREARAAASFEHPGAVVVYDVFEHEGSAYMAMELVSGRTLRSYIGDASIPIEKRLRWLVDIARALGAAHRAGLVHRDVKPHNVMVRDDGAVKVLDFGIARSHHRSQPLAGEDTAQTLGTLTEAGAVVGTPLYASPEQLSAAAVDERSDQFAWGVMGYELCCGLLPWRRRDTLTMLAQLVSGDLPTMLQRVADAAAAHQEATAQGTTSRSSPPPPDPALYADVPPEIEPVLRRAMRREPDERYPTIDDAADELEEHAEAPPSMRYVPRTTMASAAEGSIDLGRSGATPAVREEGSNPSHPSQKSAGARREGATPPTAGGRRPEGATPPTAGGRRPEGGTPPTGQTHASRVAQAPARAGAAPSSETPRSPFGPVTADAASEPLASSPSPLSATPISDAASTTGGRIATGGTTADAGPLRSEPPPPEEEPAPVWRRTTVLIAGFAVLAAAAVGVATAWQDRFGSGATEPPPPATAAPAVDRVACAPAEVSGASPTAGSHALFGQAACVRLAIALGVPWVPAPAAGAPASPPLSVTIEGAESTHATVSLAGRTASADAPRPLAAVDAAARALAEKLAAPPVRMERQTELGADGEDSARRIEAILRRRAARTTEDPAAELSEALRLGPRSPWPRLIALSDASGQAAQRLRDEVLIATSTLPEPLAEAARGALWLHAPKADAEREGALPALRRAYAARPDDGLVAAALAEALLREGLYDEAAAIGLRMAERAPDRSLAPLAALVQGGPPDPAWTELRGKLLDRLEAVLPEARAWDTRVWHEALAGRVDQARASLALGDALGLPSATGRAWARDLARAAVEIADDRPDAARPLVQPFLGSPSPAEAALAARLLVKAHLLSGRVADAETALAHDIARLDALGDRARAAERWITLLGVRRRLGQPPPELADVAKLTALLPAIEAAESPLAPALRAEIFLVQLARKEKKPEDAKEVQAAIEAYARKAARGDRTRHDDLAAAALPVALAGSGAEGLRALWASLDRARFSATLPHLFAYGVASEKAGDDAEAERAYRTVATSPLVVDGLDHLAARLRLARLLDRLGRKDEAAKWHQSTTRILSGADRGVAEALAPRP